MNYPVSLDCRLTRHDELITIGRYRFSGYWEVTKEHGGQYYRRLFDTGREAWAYYRTNRIN